MACVSSFSDGSSLVSGRFDDTSTFGDFTLTSVGGRTHSLPSIHLAISVGDASSWC